MDRKRSNGWFRSSVLEVKSNLGENYLIGKWFDKNNCIRKEISDQNQYDNLD